MNARSTAAAVPRIVKVLEVVDTREWTEGPDDRWYPIPGSGNAHECNRCGRLHEVHATVELDDGSTRVMGTGCMKAESAEVIRAMRSAERTAKKARCGTFERRMYAALAAEYHKAEADIAALPLPDWTVTLEQRRDGPVLVFRMGDADVWSLRTELSDADRAERVACLVGLWRSHRMTERGIGWKHGRAVRALADA